MRVRSGGARGRGWEMLLLRRTVGARAGLVRPVAAVRAPCVCAGRSGGPRGLAGRGWDSAGQRVAPLATAASRWPDWSLDEWGGGRREAVPAPLQHPWRAGLAGRGFAKAVRVSVEVEQARNKDPNQMLNMFRRKCRQNNIQSIARAKRYHKKPTQVRRARVTRCAEHHCCGR